MANITKPRDNKPHAPESELDDPIAAGVKLIKGAMYGLNGDGFAVNMESGVAAQARGEVLYSQDNTNGDDGDLRVRGKSGVFELHILNTDAVDIEDVGEFVYAQDNQTIAKTDNSAARPIMGQLMQITRSGKAAVRVGPVKFPPDADGDDYVWVHVGTVSTKASDNGVLRMPALEGGTLAKVKTELNDALATGDATLQAKVNGTNVTGGLVTMTQAASAAGDVDSATCSAANTFVENDSITFVVGGTSDATGTAEVYALIKR